MATWKKSEKRRADFDVAEFLKQGRSIRIRVVALMENMRWFGTSRATVPPYLVSDYVEPIKRDVKSLMALKGLPVEKVNQLKELIFTLDDMVDIYTHAEEGNPRNYDVIQRCREALALINQFRSPYDRFVIGDMIPAVG